MPLAEVVQSILGNRTPLGVGYDGSAVGPSDTVATLVIRSPDAISRIRAIRFGPPAPALFGSRRNRRQ